MIGNESKDRRSKPSSHAFQHVAYLETVREIPYAYAIQTSMILNGSFLMHLLPSQLRILVVRDLIPFF
jgi:hypothetical protein